MKRILLALIVILTVASMTVGGTFAGFCDTEMVTDNYFTTGTMDLKVAIASPSWVGDDYYDDEPYGPGLERCLYESGVTQCNKYTAYLKLFNAGTCDATASLHLKVTSPPDPGALPAGTDVTIRYETSGSMKVVKFGTLADHTTPGGIACKYWTLGGLDAGEIGRRLSIEFHPQSGWKSGSYLTFKAVIGLVSKTSFCDTEETYGFLARAGQGCTPGAWKNRLLGIGEWDETGYSPDDTVVSVFSKAAPYVDPDTTLLEALRFYGGSGTKGGARILLRAAVAAVLNEAHPKVDYPWSNVNQIRKAVNEALASGDRDTMIALAEALDADNNLGSPFP